MSKDDPLYASHILGTSKIRIFDASIDNSYDKEIDDSHLPTTWSPSNIKDHIGKLLNLAPRKLDCLILINTGLFNYKLANNAVKAVTDGTVVKIIPALMARFMYVTNNFVSPIAEDEHILILTQISNLTDIHVLQRKDSSYRFHHEFLGPSNVPAFFIKYAKKYVAESGRAVVIYDNQNVAVKNEIMAKAKGIQITQTLCANWDEMLLSGGLNKASTLIHEIAKINIDVSDFTIGFQLNINGAPGCDDGEKIKLVHVGASLPLKVHEEIKMGKRVKIRSNATTVWKEPTYKRLMNPYYSDKLAEDVYAVDIEIEENGVERISILPKDAAQTASSADEPKKSAPIPPSQSQKSPTTGSQNIPLSTQKSKKNGRKATSKSPTAPRTPSTGANSIPLADPQKRRSRSNENTRSPIRNCSTEELPPPTVSPQMDYATVENKSLILPNPGADFMVCLDDNLACINLRDKGNITRRITTINGSKWVPLYISFSEMPPLVGEAAKADLENYPEFVVYDILKILSVPYSELVIDPKWAFNVASTGRKDDHTVIEVQTRKGAYAVDPISLLALIFIALQKEAERVAGRKLRRVFVKKSSPLRKEESIVIKEAVKFAKIEFAGCETGRFNSHE